MSGFEGGGYDPYGLVKISAELDALRDELDTQKVATETWLKRATDYAIKLDELGSDYDKLFDVKHALDVENERLRADLQERITAHNECVTERERFREATNQADLRRFQRLEATLKPFRASSLCSRKSRHD
jgi:uncharacterized membrane-anchored protein YhcB (DUF1043 family)